MKPFLPDGFRYLKDQLYIEGVSLAVLAREFGTPLYVYSRSSLISPYLRLENSLSALHPTICFAVKSNSNLSILGTLKKLGSGADLVSGGELKRALLVGFDPKKIVFSGVGKTDEEILLGMQSHILSFNVESISEVHQIARLAATVRLPGRPLLTLRYNPDVSAKTHPYISTGLKKNKFGMNRKEILAICSQQAQCGSVELGGLSIHIGSQICSLAPLKEAIQKLLKLKDEVESILGRPLAILDLGGGLGIRYRDECPPSIEEYGAMVSKLLKPVASIPNPTRVLLEPGRLIAGNSGILITRVLHRKVRDGKAFAVVDAGMNDLMRPALYQSYHQILPLVRSSAKTSTVEVVGPVCESSDSFGPRRLSLPESSTGALLGIFSAGAYGASMASHYNTRSKPAEVLVSQEDYALIRIRDSFDELIRSEETHFRGLRL